MNNTLSAYRPARRKVTVEIQVQDGTADYDLAGAFRVLEQSMPTGSRWLISAHEDRKEIYGSSNFGCSLTSV